MTKMVELLIEKLRNNYNFSYYPLIKLKDLLCSNAGFTSRGKNKILIALLSKYPKKRKFTIKVTKKPNLKKLTHIFRV